jgi:hypothetical protein
MDWEYKLKELSNYDITFEIKQGYYHISIDFIDGWDIILPENNDIYVEKRNGKYHYIASTDAIGINDLFKCIEQTINYNKDLEKKLELFKEKTAKLQEIFSKENYEKLKTLEFVFPPQKKTKKKTKDKKITIEKSENNTTDVTDEINTTVTNAENEQQYTNDVDDEKIVVMNNGEYMEELEK